MKQTKLSTKLVIVMRSDMGLSKGILVASGASASVKSYKDAMFRPHSSEDLYNWFKCGSPSVCLKVDSLSELHMVVNRATKRLLLCHSVTTEEGELVCTSIGPASSVVIDEVTGSLRLL